MKKSLLLGTFVLGVCGIALGQGSLGGVPGSCELPGQQVLVSGIPSTGTQAIVGGAVSNGSGVMASYPQCLVTVYLTGTLTKATIYSNNPASSPTVLANPFTANTDGSWQFFVATGACYDITMGSGIGPPMPLIRTLADVCVGGGGGSGGITEVLAGAGITVTPSGTTVTVAITNTAVTPGSYTNPNITVGADGRLTAATNGTCEGAITGTGLNDLIPYWTSSSNQSTATGFTFSPGTGINPGNVNADVQNQVVTVTSDYNFTACAAGPPTCTSTITSPSTLVAGSNTVTMASCPVGVNGADAAHYLRVVPGVGDTIAEPVLITGGSCTSGATSGTVTFSAGYSHIAGYGVGSATTGISEAYETVSPPKITVKLVPTSTYTVYAPFFVRGGSSVLDGQMATIVDSSIGVAGVVGGTTATYPSTTNGELYDISHIVMEGGNAVWNQPITGAVTDSSPNATLTLATCPSGFYANIPGQILWLAGTSSGIPTTVFGYGEPVVTTGGGSTCQPGVSNGTVKVTAVTGFGVTNLSPHDSGSSLSFPAAPFWEDAAAQNAHFHDMKLLSNGSLVMGDGFQFDNDQAASLDNIDFEAGFGGRTDSAFQASVAFGPGPYSINAAILNYGPNVNVGSAGFAHCVNWLSGNDFTMVGKNVCQDYSAGAFIVGLKRGGFGTFDFGSGLHPENPGTISSPWGVPLGNPAIMVVGAVNKAVQNESNTFGTGIAFSLNGDAPYPQFLPAPVSQTTEQVYYVRAHNNTSTGCTSGDCISVPWLIGAAVVNDPSANPVTVSWFGAGANDPAISGTVPVTSYDILRVSGSASATNPPQPPNGGAACVVASGITPASACSLVNLCQITDNVAAGSLGACPSITSQGNSKNAYFIDFLMPGFVAMSGNGQAGSGSTTDVGSMAYRGRPTCLNSMEYPGGDAVASFTGASFGSEGDVGVSCPSQYAPIMNFGHGQICASSASPAVCGFAKSGTVTMTAAATTFTINTTAVQPWSIPSAFDDPTKAVALGLGSGGCDTNPGRTYVPTSISYGVSVTFTASAGTSSGKPACLDFVIQ